ncbi:MAG: ABC transporter ATP-binding protein [Wenzhouxiangella sp.]|jgi:ATP-binding cassette subfamily B protein|nr:ABC transporter ATP-binding protein [Wenzhouxiangella sp.]
MPDARSDPALPGGILTQFGSLLTYGRRALALVWATSPLLTFALAGLTLVAGLLPAGIAWVGKLLVDSVVAAIQTDAPTREVWLWLSVEALLVAAMAAAQTGLNICNNLLRAQLGQRVNVMILEKAQQLELAQLEDAEFYDRLTRARREASSRPLALVQKTFGVIQNGISILSFSGLLLAFSPWAVLLLIMGGLPAFFVEAKFAGQAFRLFRWRSPETREMMYLESVLARDDYTKEVKLFGLGPKLLERYRTIFAKIFREDRALTIRRGWWAFALGLLGTATLYAAFAWVVLATVSGQLSLGQMTMYLMVFRQGQSAVSASLTSINGMYEDYLYLSSLYEFLELPVRERVGGVRQGAAPGTGLEIQDLSFRYPGSETLALDAIQLDLKPGTSLALVGENGSGKTTLTKLIAGLYEVEQGDIRLDGTSLKDWERRALQDRIGVIFQDFARYQWLVGHNIGAGDVRDFDDENRWREAARKGLADAFIAELPAGYQTQLGRWFKDGQELSGGQWQKIALARAFMRSDADILILDEPTAAMDAKAEAEVFEHFQAMAENQILILISHRFSTVRRADQIAVMEHGRIIELGSHEALMALGGRYAQLFELQARAYR